jgi:hypothetical protein
MSFWLTLFLFVVVGVMLVNHTFWSNQRYEAQYRKKRWQQQRDAEALQREDR